MFNTVIEKDPSEIHDKALNKIQKIFPWTMVGSFQLLVEYNKIVKDLMEKEGENKC